MLPELQLASGCRGSVCSAASQHTKLLPGNTSGRGFALAGQTLGNQAGKVEGVEVIRMYAMALHAQFLDSTVHTEHMYVRMCVCTQYTHA